MSPQLTIDGRSVEVPEGTSVLDAARELGIRIPTLCHRRGVEPRGSCLLCVVQIGESDRLVPSCVCPAEDGMDVTTDSARIRRARRDALELLLSDHRGDCEGPCTLACPAGLDIPGFLRQIVDDDLEGALRTIRRTIPLPLTLGRICPEFCERACRRDKVDEPLAVRALKRYVGDTEYAGEAPVPKKKRSSTGQSVAIVGAGPAGLTAAYYLLRQGHECVLHDAGAKPGGMLRFGVPEFRLPADVVDREVAVIRRLGADFRQETALGRDVELDELREEYDAVLLACGAHAPEDETESVTLSGRDFLRDVAEGRTEPPGTLVTVLGPGAEAIACARTALRLGAGHVTLVSPESRRRTSGVGDQLEDAESEGVAVETGVDVTAVHDYDDGIEIECRRDGETFILNADAVVRAPARRVDTDMIEEVGLEVSRGGIDAERDTGATALEGVFAAGEVMRGPGSTVRALASGRKAAAAIHQFLQGDAVTGETEQVNSKLGRLDSEEEDILLDSVEREERISLPRKAAADRLSMEETEDTLSGEDARREAARCLDCDCLDKHGCKLRRHATTYDASTSSYRGECRGLERDESHPTVVYEPGKCILCGLCVRIAGDLAEGGLTFINRGFDTRTRTPFGSPLGEALSVEQAEECAKACPTGALARRRKPAGSPAREKD